MKITHNCFVFFVSIVISSGLFTLPFNINAETLTVTVTNQSAQRVADSVISAYPQSSRHNPPTASNKTIVIDQIDKEFIDHVTAIQMGTAIQFPNHDQIRHHVYSFSPAKAFEIPLYKGLPAKPIVFDKPGLVTLGCNIHDWMSAYIYVVNTTYFSITNQDGQASLELPPGHYEIRYWHADIDITTSPVTQTISLASGSPQNTTLQLNLKKTWSFRRGPLSLYNRGRYR